jgi:CheY-like chemotaxis protein
MYLQEKRIFVVEDNVGSRTIMELLFEQHGATVIFTPWDSETVARLRGFAPIDLIILDLMLPDGITGYNVFDVLHGLTEFEHIPILAVSAAYPATAIPEAQTRGFCGFIGKPIHYNTFPQQVARVIAGEEIWQADFEK